MRQPGPIASIAPRGIEEPIDRTITIGENYDVEVVMSVSELEKRVRVLEREVARLRRRLQGTDADLGPWWEQIAGSFKGDRAFKEAMRLGWMYRKSLRPGRRKRTRR